MTLHKGILVGFVLAACAQPGLRAQSGVKPVAVIGASEASGHVGEYVELTGPVAEVFVAPRGNFMLDLVAPYPKQAIKIMIPKQAVAAFGDPHQFDGKTVKVFGVVFQDPKAGIALIVRSQKQIQVVSSTP